MTLAALLAAVCLQTRADGYKYLVAAYNGEEASYELATVQKITFEDGNVVITTSEGVVSLPEEEMEKMYFSATSTRVNSLPLAAEGLSVSGNTLLVSGKGLLYIYNMGGQLIEMAKVDGQMNISLSSLPHGLYVVSMGGESIKFVKE